LRAKIDAIQPCRFKRKKVADARASDQRQHSDRYGREPELRAACTRPEV
jgi:hypothetical protein